MDRTYSIANMPTESFDNAIMAPGMLEAFKKISQRVAEDADRSIFGMPIRTNPFMPEGSFVLDGPKQMAFMDTKTGKGCVVDKPLPFLRRPLDFKIEPVSPCSWTASCAMPIFTYPRVVYSHLPCDIGPVVRVKVKPERWRKPMHSKKRDGRR